MANSNLSLNVQLERAIFMSSAFERIENPFWIDIQEFLEQYSPKKKSMLNRILRKLGFKYSGSLIVDMTMPMNVGGYFIPGGETIAINPMLLLYGSEKSVAHVIFHEGLHAGVFTEEGIQDESLTEAMTKKKMSELYGSNTFKSGYDSLVSDFNEFFGDTSFDDLATMVEGGDMNTFNNLLDVIVVQPSLSQGLESLSWNEIANKLGKKWGMLQKLFPRMMNKLAGSGAGPHEKAQLAFQNFEIDGVLEKAARKVFESNSDLINDLFDKITNKGKDILDLEKIKKELFKLGFGYLHDYEPDLMNRKIRTYITIKTNENILSNIAAINVPTLLAFSQSPK